MRKASPARATMIRVVQPRPTKLGLDPLTVEAWRTSAKRSAGRVLDGALIFFIYIR